ncbi:MAG: hypothetical protein QXO40_03195 [Candidatus Aenigmatarchaeota archaeon]
MLQDFLAPDENIRYRSPGTVEFAGDEYEFYITDRRFVWYKREGLIFKKDKIIMHPLDQVKEIRYREAGILRKKAIIEIWFSDKKHEFSGSLSTMRAIYSEMQVYMKPILS